MTDLEIKLLELAGELVAKIVMAIMSANNLTSEQRKNVLDILKTQLDATAARVAAVKVD